VERRSLGPLTISPIGVGTAPFGASPEWRVRWPEQEPREAVRAVHRAFELGVNWIDTAPFYGWGRAEEIVGRALAGRRDEVLVVTKCGTFPDPEREDLRPASIRRDLERSLRRLRTDRVDLLQFHDPDPATPIEESWGAVQELIGEGKVRFGGLSNHPPELVERALAVGEVTAVQHQLSLLRRDVERDVLPFAERHGIGVIVWSPLASGFLTDEFDLASLGEEDFRRHHPFAQLDLEELRRALRSTADSHGATMAQVALAWGLSRRAVSGAIVGVRSARESEGLPRAAELQLSDRELRALEAAAP
jgi:aryl-alcohol dehydrogenase-like predicted oxidoreductase